MQSGPASRDEIEAANARMFADSWISASPPEFRHALLGRCKWRWHGPGEILSHAGSDRDTVYGLASGTLAIASGLGGSELRLSHIINAGEWFGISPIFTGARRVAEIAVRAPSLVAHLAAADVAVMTTAQPVWWREFGRLAVFHAGIASAAVADLMIPDNRRRCAATLLRLAGIRHRDRAHDAAAVVVHIGQDELGTVANLSRNSVNRILRAFEAANLVRVAYRAITLLDPGRLRTLIDS